MSLELELTNELKSFGADFIHFIDVSNLSVERNKKYPRVVLFGMALSPEYLQKITNTSDFVQKLVKNNQVNEDEFHLKETKTDSMADYLADYLKGKGYSAYSQSEKNIELTGFYNEKTKSTPLPHKIIARLAGLGWIGKNNLLVTPEYGCAISMCTVLTNAPLTTVKPAIVDSQCGVCKVCEAVCKVDAITGKPWNINGSRDDLINVYKCKSCLECMVFCPFTQDYVKKNLSQKELKRL